MLAVVAIVVAIKLGPAAIKLFSALGKVGAAVAGGALAGVAGSGTSLSLGPVTGIQSKFNWVVLPLQCANHSGCRNKSGMTGRPSGRGKAAAPPRA
ncbi:MAG: hypothetical protein A4S16_14600 [Proteobacteria bacterium SG_bin6]|nr:MAG: hypothetical protein A4S16_14600 [Proteobacteria bacterium SG_bin6]